MKVDIYNAWEHLRIDDEEERRLLAAGLVKHTADGEWRFNETCFICRHWVYQGLERNLTPIGECRHDPPVINDTGGEADHLRGVWPYTHGHQFCGAIETHLSEQQLTERVAQYRKDCRRRSSEGQEIRSVS
ncbi:hypothetical protein [Endothiovibrio diazotrophicus]